MQKKEPNTLEVLMRKLYEFINYSKKYENFDDFIRQKKKNMLFFYKNLEYAHSIGLSDQEIINFINNYRGENE